MSVGQVVVLNGTPRSGKSSLARAVQANLDGVWMNLGVDGTLAATPERFRMGLRPGGERPDLEPLVVAQVCALFDAVAAHASQGLNVVVDVGLHDDYRSPLDLYGEARRRLRGIPALWVGVRCPAEANLARRQATGMTATLEIVERWDRAVHRDKAYDLEIDTSQSTPQEGAEAIQRVFGKLREST